MSACTIRYLDAKSASTVVDGTPYGLEVGWGDRVSRQHHAPVVYGRIDGSSHAEPGLGVEVGEHGDWWRAQPVTVRGWWYVGACERYLHALTPEQEAAARATYDAVATAWVRAVEADPTIAAAVEGYRCILDGIERAHRDHESQWAVDERRIARAFRRARVRLGEQTVPGKVCVRSVRGTLLGFADCWDGRWLGTVERL